MNTIPEPDWIYLRSCKDDLLNTLCARIGAQASEILNSTDTSPHERYGRLYDHIKKSDRIIADCFDGWRRSNIPMKLSAIDSHGLLTVEHKNKLSSETRQMLRDLHEIRTQGTIGP